MIIHFPGNYLNKSYIYINKLYIKILVQTTYVKPVQDLVSNDQIFGRKSYLSNNGILLFDFRPFEK